MKIVHISDLHITGHYFVKEWGDKIVKIINDLSPDMLVITGDLTDFGYLFEYKKANDYISRFKVGNLIVVPGNHDARNEGYIIFEEVFGGRFPFFENEEVIILGLDSSEPDIDDGHIGRGNYDFIREKLEGKKQKKIIAMHHHLIPIPGTGRERNIPVDAGDALRLITNIGVDIVLSGHKHLPWIWRLEKTLFITAGTATSKRLKGRSYPSFNIIEIFRKRIRIYEINVENEAKREVFKNG